MAIGSEPADDDVAELRALLLAGQRFRQAIADHFKLSLSETVALGHLADAGGQLVPSELAERMLLGSGTLTAVIDRLAQHGHVQRRPHSHDRRRIYVVLTPAGRRVIRYAHQHMERTLAAANTTSTTSPPRLGPLAAALDAETEQVLHRRTP
jgi:DNA-binding MarR family transcriptional regulator